MSSKSCAELQVLEDFTMTLGLQFVALYEILVCLIELFIRSMTVSFIFRVLTAHKIGSNDTPRYIMFIQHWGKPLQTLCVPTLPQLESLNVICNGQKD